MSEILDDFESQNHLKERHGCVTAWIIVAMIVNALLVLVYLFANDVIASEYSHSISPMLFIGLGILALANVGCIYLISQWKKMGFYGLILTNIFAAGINMSIEPDPSGIASGIIGIGIIYAILQAKGNGISAWDNLE